jgi:hypothetical protein
MDSAAAQAKRVEHEPVGAEDFSKKAHGEALGLLLAQVEAYVRESDPVRSSFALGRPLALPLLPGTRGPELAKALQDIEEQARELRSSALEPRDALRLASIEAFVGRESWRLEPTTPDPASSDALYYLVELELLVDLALWRLLAAADCADCMAALAEIPNALRASEAALVDLSLENQRALGPRAEALAQQVLALAPLGDVAARTALERSARALDAHAARVEGLPATGEGELPWDEEAVLARSGSVIRRPGAWGGSRVSDYLKSEEAYAPGATEFRIRAQRRLESFRAMRQRLVAVESDTPTRSVAAPVDGERCEVQWRRAVEFAKRSAGIAPHLDCQRVVTWLDGQRLDDAQLADELVRHGLVPAMSNAIAQQRGGLMAALGGRWNRVNAYDLRTVMFAFPLGLERTGTAALLRLEHRVCATTAAIELHTGSSDGKLHEWLERWCPQQSAGDWEVEVFGDPRGSFAGFPILMMGGQPVDMVPVVEYWWAMYGISQKLAKPRGPAGRAQPSPKGDSKFNLERLELEGL